MNDNFSGTVLEQQLRAALGSPKQPDFGAWQSQHAKAIAHLNPTVTAQQRRKKKLLIWSARAALAIAATVLVLLGLNLNGDKESFAQAVKAIESAHTVTWTTTMYERVYSRDGQRTWLKTQRQTHACLHPGLIRTTTYDKDGNVYSVEITDSINKKTLFLQMQSMKASFTTHPHYVYFDPQGRGPFAEVADLLKSEPIELVGQRKWKDKTVNVIRYHRKYTDERVKNLMAGRDSSDLWIDAETKQLVGTSDPGADIFDPTTLPDRNNSPEKTFSKGEPIGNINDEIVFDAKLDPQLFSMTPPEGFEVVVEPSPPAVTEKEMIQYLDTTARFNNGIFTDSALGPDFEQLQKAARKDKSDRTEAEQKMVDLDHKYLMRRIDNPIGNFARTYAAPGSFQYLGKGVKLGDADRVVCWYKLKSTDKYRTVYGDLAVKDVDPKDLPLPVK